MKKLVKLMLPAAIGASLLATQVQAADYVIDTKGAHAFIQFRVKHLGYSWLYGDFTKFSGNFSYDEAKPEEASVEVTIDTTSVHSNHAERDKHIRSADFLDAGKYPEAKFKSTSFDGKTLTGDLTLHGVTKSISFDVEKIGEGKDPWGGYRAGFEGTFDLNMGDFGIEAAKKLGPASGTAEMTLSIEGIRKK